MRLASLSVLALAMAAQTAQAAPIQWTLESGGNGHSYELLVDTGYVDHATALDVVAGLGGYLVTITSQAEQDFLNAVINPNSVLAWLGASDAASENDWFWDEPGGPVEFDYTNWAAFEPNDNNGEDVLHGWWGAGGSWNDIYPSYTSVVLVEYSPAAVPVPAALPMLGAGIAALVALRRRKKA